ncbi:hypothetical protein DPSP01_010817 [Paraphaeosphaeria sporulosa]
MFQTTFEDGSEATFFVRKHIQHNYPSFESVYRIIEGKWTMAGSWPLMQRAWAFQERLLSPRVLHLGPSELVWECQEHTRCECSEKDSQFDSPHLIRKSEWCNGLRHHSQKTASELWQKIVKEYSCRRLTFQRDVFPALSGIAKQFHQSFEGTSENPGTYLAGLWRNDLMQQLMWFTTTANCVSKPVGLRELPAPSWSWAAAEGPGIAFFQSMPIMNEFSEQAEILQTQVLLLGLHRGEKFHEHHFTKHHHDDLAEFMWIQIHLDFDYDFIGKYTHTPWEAEYTTEDVYVANMGIARIGVDHFRRVALILKNSNAEEKFERIGIAFFDSRQDQPECLFQRKGKSMLLDIF